MTGFLPWGAAFFCLGLSVGVWQPWGLGPVCQPVAALVSTSDRWLSPGRSRYASGPSVARGAPDRPVRARAGGRAGRPTRRPWPAVSAAVIDDGRQRAPHAERADPADDVAASPVPRRPGRRARPAARPAPRRGASGPARGRPARRPATSRPSTDGDERLEDAAGRHTERRGRLDAVVGPLVAARGRGARPGRSRARDAPRRRGGRASMAGVALAVTVRIVPISAMLRAAHVRPRSRAPNGAAVALPRIAARRDHAGATLDLRFARPVGRSPPDRRRGGLHHPDARPGSGHPPRPRRAATSSPPPRPAPARPPPSRCRSSIASGPTRTPRSRRPATRSGP